MQKRWLPFWLLVLLLVPLAGCPALGPGDGPAGDSLTPTPPVPVFGDFILGVATSDPTGLGAAPQKFFQSPSSSTNKSSVSFFSGGIVVNETRNTISDITFKPDNEGAEIDFPGLYVVELVKQGVQVNLEFPGFDVTHIPFDTYHAFEFKLEKMQSEDIPEELLQDLLVTNLLLDNTVVVEGSFLESGDNDIDGNGVVNYIPFQVISDQNSTIEVSSPNSFSVTADKVNYFFIAFQVENWFQGLLPQFQNLDSADLTDGVAVIQNDGSNPAIQDILQDFDHNLEIFCKSAPSQDGEFEEDDVDGESSSGGVF